MMSWIDIAGIVFVCVTANHLGLVSAIERTIKARLWVVDCPKCSAFWATLAYGCYTVATDGTARTDANATGTVVIAVLAVSFLASYAAIWLELIEGYIDTLYMKLYETIDTTDADDTVAADADSSDTAGTMSDM